MPPSSRSLIIDLHCHAAGIGAGASGCFVNPRLLRSYKFGFYLRAFGVSRRELAESGDALVLDRIAAGIAASTTVGRAVVLALDGVVDAQGRLDTERTECFVPDAFVADGVAHRPGLLFGASIHPRRRDALERLEHARDRGAVLVKWLPAIQDFDPADPRFTPFYRKLAEVGLPLLTHTGPEHSFTWARDDYSDPERLRLALSLGVTVIAAHAAASGVYEGEPASRRLSRLMREYSNLFADLSALTQVNRVHSLPKVLAQPELRGRILYGTDFPIVAMRALVSPWPFVRRLGFTQARAIASITNPWDRDVALKRALGVGQRIFERPAQVLGLAGASFHDRSQPATGLRPNT